METTTIFQKHVGRTRLEIAGLFGRFLGSIYYQSPDGRFERGGLDLVIEAAGAMIEELRDQAPLGRLFMASFEPVVPHGSDQMAEAEAMFRDFEARLKGQPRQKLGTRYPLSGVWLGLEEGLGLLREIGPRCVGVSAEDSFLRLACLDSTRDEGWDLMHEYGATHLGRWDQNGSGKPGSMATADRPIVESALSAARDVLSRRLEGK